MWQTVTTVAAIVAAVAYMRKYTTQIGEAIMATQAENQARLDAVADRQDKAYTEIVAGIEELKAAAAAGQDLDFTRVEGGAGLLDDLHADVVAEVPPVDETPVEEPVVEVPVEEVPVEVPAEPVAEDESTV